MREVSLDFLQSTPAHRRAFDMFDSLLYHLKSATFHVGVGGETCRFIHINTNTEDIGRGAKTSAGLGIIATKIKLLILLFWKIQTYHTFLSSLKKRNQRSEKRLNKNFSRGKAEFNRAREAFSSSDFVYFQIWSLSWFMCF